jgi:hypothetical protein
MASLFIPVQDLAGNTDNFHPATEVNQLLGENIIVFINMIQLFLISVRSISWFLGFKIGVVLHFRKGKGHV